MPPLARTPPRVLIAGGGVAALEALLALQALAGDRVTLELLAPDRHFTYRPLAVTEPFAHALVHRVPLAAIGLDRNVRIHRDALARVRPDDRVVETQGGQELRYDSLVLALGARVEEAVPGALTFRGSQDAQRIRSVLDSIRQGEAERVAFVVPPGSTWALPVYELALQAEVAVRDEAPDARLAVVTSEPAPLAAFGHAAGTAVGELLGRRGIALHTATHADAFVGGELRAGGRRTGWDRVIALPRLVGPRVRGVPCDGLGFVPVDEHMRALGMDAVYAVGDMAGHDVKQGGLATQQAGVAAAAIAADAGAPVPAPPFEPVLRGVLLTGDGVLYLRRDAAGAGEVSDELLWWPPAKIAGRHLAPYLAGRPELPAPLDVRRAPALAPPPP